MTSGIENQPQNPSRRRFLKGAVSIAGLGGLAALGVDCGGDDDDISQGTAIPRATSTETATATASPTPEITPSPEPTGLKDFAAKRGITVGSQVTTGILSYASMERNIVEDYNLTNVSGAFWGGNGTMRDVRPNKTDYDFTDLDPVIKFSNKNDTKMLAFHLVWGNKNAVPRWLTTGNFSGDELQSMVSEHIGTMMQHFREQRGEDADITWSVVNEYFPFPEYNFWYAKGGESLLYNAFRRARQVDPKAKLLLNNFGNENIGNTSDTDYQRVAKLKQEGIVDRYGLQMHLRGEVPLDLDSMKKNIDRFQKLGVEVDITEMDVDMSKFPGTQEEKDVKQAQIYKDVLDAFFAMGGKTVSFFGGNDAYSWLGSSAKGTLYTEYNDPKPARQAVEDSIIQVPLLKA